MTANNKGFYKYIGDKRKMRENVSLLLKKTRDQVTEDIEKAEVLNAFFASDCNFEVKLDQLEKIL